MNSQHNQGTVHSEVHHEETHRTTVPAPGGPAPAGAGYQHGVAIEAPNVHIEEKHGLLHDIKEGVKDVVSGITGGGHKTEPTPKEHAKEAAHLQKKAESVLDHTSKEFKKAEKAQEKADKEAAKANEKTQKALHEQAKGQEYLAEAGAEMMKAGAKMQQEAASSVHQTPFNIHQKGEIQQTTNIATGAQQGAAAEAAYGKQY